MSMCEHFFFFDGMCDRNKKKGKRTIHYVSEFAKKAEWAPEMSSVLLGSHLSGSLRPSKRPPLKIVFLILCMNEICEAVYSCCGEKESSGLRALARGRALWFQFSRLSSAGEWPPRVIVRIRYEVSGTWWPSLHPLPPVCFNYNSWNLTLESEVGPNASIRNPVGISHCLQPPTTRSDTTTLLSLRHLNGNPPGTQHEPLQDTARCQTARLVSSAPGGISGPCHWSWNAETRPLGSQIRLLGVAVWLSRWT